MCRFFESDFVRMSVGNHRMYFIVKRVLLGLILVSLVSCTHYVYISRSPWQANNITIDGKAADWPGPLKYYDEKSKLQYAITNDSYNLYFCIKAPAEQTQIKMLRAGMQLWIDTTGKNEHQAGVLFPLASWIKRADQNTDSENKAGRRDLNGFRKRFLNDYKEMELSGFKPPVNGLNPLQSSCGITTSVNWDTSGIMTYEAVIPFKTFYKDSLSDADSLKLIGVTIVLNALPGQKSRGAGNGGVHSSSRGMGGGGIGRGGSYGRSGGHNGGGHNSGGSQVPYESTYLFETISVKKTIELAVKSKAKY